MMINRDHDINQVSHGINYKTTIKFPPTTKTPAFTSVILFNYSTSEKRSCGWHILKSSTHLLIWTGFSTTTKSLGNNHRPNTLPLPLNQEVTQTPVVFYFFYDKKGEN